MMYFWSFWISLIEKHILVLILMFLMILSFWFSYLRIQLGCSYCFWHHTPFNNVTWLLKNNVLFIDNQVFIVLVPTIPCMHRVDKSANFTVVSKIASHKLVKLTALICEIDEFQKCSYWNALMNSNIIF